MKRSAKRRRQERYPKTLLEIPRHLWPAHAEPPQGLVRVLRSRDFLVQEYRAEDVPIRLTVNRVARTGLDWKDRITWDDLQRIKAEAGYGGHDAVEVFPRDCDTVNDANMRHLWVVNGLIPFAWRNHGPSAGGELDTENPGGSACYTRGDGTQGPGDATPLRDCDPAARGKAPGASVVAG